MPTTNRIAHLQKVEQIAEKVAELLCAADINDKIKIAFADTVFCKAVDVKERADFAEKIINPYRPRPSDTQPNFPKPNIQEARLYLVFIAYCFIHLLEEHDIAGDFQAAYNHAENFISKSMKADFGAFEDIEKFGDYVLGCLFERIDLGAKSLARYNAEKRSISGDILIVAFYNDKQVWRVKFCQTNERENFIPIFPVPLYPTPFYFATSSQKTIAKNNKRIKK